MTTMTAMMIDDACVCWTGDGHSLRCARSLTGRRSVSVELDRCAMLLLLLLLLPTVCEGDFIPFAQSIRVLCGVMVICREMPFKLLLLSKHTAGLEGSPSTI